MGKYTVNFVEETDAYLDEAVELGVAPSKADVVRDALSIHRAILQEVRSGSKLLITRDGGHKFNELLIPSFERVRPPEPDSPGLGQILKQLAGRITVPGWRNHSDG